MGPMWIALAVLVVVTQLPGNLSVPVMVPGAGEFIQYSGATVPYAVGTFHRTQDCSVCGIDTWEYQDCGGSDGFQDRVCLQCHPCDGLVELQRDACEGSVDRVCGCKEGYGGHPSGTTRDEDPLCAGPIDCTTDSAHKCPCICGECPASLTTCTACPKGQFSPASSDECLHCTESSDFADVEGSGQCSPCSLSCSSGSYISEPCTVQSDRVCSDCLTSCMRGKELSGDCPGTTTESNSCISCVDGETWKDKEGPEFCTVCTSCDASGQVEDMACTPTSDAVCGDAPCDHGSVARDNNVAVCTCDTGYAGGGNWNSEKQTYASPCEPVACAHGEISDDKTSCQCDMGWENEARAAGMFDHSTREYPVCQPVLCENGDVNEGQTFCQCRPDFYGGGILQTDNTFNICNACSACGTGFYRHEVCTEYADADCQPCDVCTTGQQFRVSQCQQPNIDDNTVCQDCKQCGVLEYASSQCTLDEDTQCSDLECQHGMVVETAGRADCVCNAGYIGGGLYNHESFPACVEQLCDDGTVTQVNTEDGTTTTCECNNFHTGGGLWDQSSGRYPACIALTCEHGVVEDLSGPHCTCDTGFVGGGVPNGNKEFLDCQEAPCINGKVTEDKATCVCDPGLAGGGAFEHTMGYPVCIECPDGQWSEGGLSKCIDCTVCVPGEHVVEQCIATSDQKCSPCVEGETYSAETNAESCLVCDKHCDKGTQPLEMCTSTTNIQCSTCVNGQNFQSKDELFACTDCTNCLAGSHVASDCTITADRVCTQCSTGFYSLDVNSNECHPCTEYCLAGEEPTQACTSTSNRACQDCEVGNSFKTAIGNEMCTSVRDCPAGSYETQAPSKTSDRECEECPPDHYSETENSKSCKKCSECGAGFVKSGSCGTQDWECVAQVCPDKHYATEDNVCAACDTCGPGFYPATECLAFKNTVCQACADSYYNDGTYNMCQPHKICGKGEYWKTSGDAETDTSCDVCPEGTFSDTEGNNPQCMACLRCSDLFETIKVCDSDADNTQCAARGSSIVHEATVLAAATTKVKPTTKLAKDVHSKQATQPTKANPSSNKLAAKPVAKSVALSVAKSVASVANSGHSEKAHHAQASKQVARVKSVNAQQQHHVEYPPVKSVARVASGSKNTQTMTSVGKSG